MAVASSTEHGANSAAFDTDVLIVGAGPAGLSMAIELGAQGIACVVVERNPRVGFAPRAKTTNVRTRELLRRWGIADRLAAASPFGIDYPAEVVFATRLGGHELARFSNCFYAKPQRDERFAEHAQWVPQYKVEEVLRSRVAELPSVQMRFSTSLDGFAQDAEGVDARLSDEGGTSNVRARYVVGADGARSSVRHLLDISMEGVSPISRHYNIVFRSPGLSKKHALGPALMYWLLNSELPAVASPMDTGDRWSFGCDKLADESIEPARLVRTALGLGDDLEVEVLSRDEWIAHQLIATDYSRDRVFLVGDACHLHPPFGGYGMNMGIGDAVDLGWKLAAVIKGWGGPKLLQSYQIERRPVHRRVIDESVLNHKSSVRQLTLDGIEDEGPAGTAARAKAGDTILANKRREFDSLGIVLGTAYGESPVLWPEAGDEPTQQESTDFKPSARPGNRAPHAWLSDGKAPGASLFDHFRADGFTLLVTRDEAGEAADAVEHSAAELGIPLSVFRCTDRELRELYGASYALIRPDQHVAWRGNDFAEASVALARAAGR
ncbi:FAD-dependent oxidoreductase [soil metagenome]